MNKFWNTVCAPFRAGRDFVDRRPTLSQVRQSLSEVEPVVRNNVTGPAFDVVLEVPDTRLKPRILLTVDRGDMSMEDCEVYADGVVKGYKLCREQVMTARRSSMAAQHRMIKKEHKLQKAAAANAEKLRPATASDKTAPIVDDIPITGVDMHPLGT